MADCVFCMIRDGKIPSAKVYDDQRTLAFMDINPLSRGHCLVVPKAHAATLYEAETEDLKAAIATAKKVAGAIRKALNPDGLNLLQANGAAAFQSVPHFHLHLIPRWTNDGKGFDWKSQGTGKRSWAPRTVSAPCSHSHGRGKSRKARVMSERKIRLVVAKPGLDGHDRGAKIVARALRDAGFEVIYTGLHQTPEQIVATAIQEDADAVGLSVLSGAHNYLFKRVLELLREKGAEDIAVFGGGIIPAEDIAALKAMGVKELFTPGATTQDIIRFVRDNIRATV